MCVGGVGAHVYTYTQTIYIHISQNLAENRISFPGKALNFL